MKLSLVATLAAIAVCWPNLCCANDVHFLFKRAASSDPGATGGAANGAANGAGNSASEAPTTDPTTTTANSDGHGTPPTAFSEPPHSSNNGPKSGNGSGGESPCDIVLDRLPPSCYDAVTVATELLFPTNNSGPTITADNLNKYSSAMEAYCSSSCIVPILDLYECYEDMDASFEHVIEYTKTYACGEFNGQLCLVIVANGIVEDKIFIDDVISSCSAGGPTACPQVCESSLSTISDILGCCTLGYVEGGWSGIEPNSYEACGLAVPETCPPITPGTTSEPPSCDSLPGLLPLSCFNAFSTVEQLLIQTDGDADVSPDTFDTFSSAIQTYCSSSCIETILDYYQCIHNSAMTEVISTFICAEFHGQFCPVIVANSTLGDQLPVEEVISFCVPNAGTACSKDCSSLLSTITDSLGCCTPGAVQLGVIGQLDTFYQACNIPLPEPCTSNGLNTTTAADASTRIHQATNAIFLHTIFIMFAMIWLL